MAWAQLIKKAAWQNGKAAKMMRSDMRQQVGSPGMTKPVPVSGKRPMLRVMPAYKKGGMVSTKGQGCCSTGKKPCKIC